MPTPTPKIAWFHCFSGISGDMALGSLIDAGADLDEIRALCERLPIDGWQLEAHPTQRCGIAATKVDISYDPAAQAAQPARTAQHIISLIEQARLPDRTARRATAIFYLLAQAEARLHNQPIEEVHFHEVGAIDSIIDIVGTAAALEVLDIATVQSSPIAQGTGVVTAAHGIMPNPAPATVEVLQGAPTYGLNLDAELTTPTGAAIVATLAASFGSMPPMTVAASGFGAGTREFEHRPNLTQVVVGEPAQPAPANPGQPTVLLETNVDDATGETLAHAVAALLEAGANDAWLTPIMMKKGRPAFKVSALADVAATGKIRQTLIEETGTMGVRAQMLERWPLPRHTDVVELADGPVRIKVAAGRAKAELEDAAKIARATGKPLREVILQAETAWMAASLGADQDAELD